MVIVMQFVFEKIVQTVYKYDLLDPIRSSELPCIIMIVKIISQMYQGDVYTPKALPTGVSTEIKQTNQ